MAATVATTTSSELKITTPSAVGGEQKESKVHNVRKATMSLEKSVAKSLYAIMYKINERRASKEMKITPEEESAGYVLVTGKTVSILVPSFLVLRHPELEAKMIEHRCALDYDDEILSLIVLSLYDPSVKFGVSAPLSFKLRSTLSLAKMIELAEISQQLGLSAFTQVIRDELYGLVTKLDDETVKTSRELMALHAAKTADKSSKPSKVLNFLIGLVQEVTTNKFVGMTYHPVHCWDSRLVRETEEGKQLPKVKMCRLSAHANQDYPGLKAAVYLHSSEGQHYCKYCCSSNIGDDSFPCPKELIRKRAEETEAVVDYYTQMVEIFGKDLITLQLTKMRNGGMSGGVPPP